MVRRKAAKKSAGTKPARKKRPMKRKPPKKRRPKLPPKKRRPKLPPKIGAAAGPVQVVIVITTTGFKEEVDAKRGNLVAFDNQTSVAQTVRFDKGWPFDPTNREILVPASDRSGWYIVDKNATLMEYTAVLVDSNASAGQTPPPGDPVLDVGG